jgi:hypothetical protein
MRHRRFGQLEIFDRRIAPEVIHLPAEVLLVGEKNETQRRQESCFVFASLRLCVSRIAGRLTEAAGNARPAYDPLS